MTTLTGNPPCPYCGEELVVLEALKSIGDFDTLYCETCGYFVSREDAEVDLQDLEKRV